MQQLIPPYDFYQPLSAEDSATLPNKEKSLLHLLAPVSGESYDLKTSPYAVDQLSLQGTGGWQRPRTQKILAPARSKLLNVSACRSYWTFALSKSLRMQIQIKAQCELPLGSAVVPAGTLVQPGQRVATISAEALKHSPMVVLTVRQLDISQPMAAAWRCGPRTAGEEPILSLYAIPAYQTTPWATLSNEPTKG